MALFLTREQLYRAIQRELPEDAYPDGAPSAFFSTADSDATAEVFSAMYLAALRIYENKFPGLAVEEIDRWLVTTYGANNTFGNLSVAQKQAKVLEKLRKRPSLSLWEIQKIVSAIVPAGIYSQVFEYCRDPNTGWVVGVSPLGVDTILGEAASLATLGVDPSEWCSYVSGLKWRLGVHGLGVNTNLASPLVYFDVARLQRKAFAYEIRIFEYSLTADQKEQLEREVSAAEPARSAHVVKDGLLLVDYGLDTVVPNVDEFSLIDCITRDSGSTTGFTGRI